MHSQWIYIFKFYQWVEVDKAAQHVRRILWRFAKCGERPPCSREHKVKYGERLAGCMAIAAVHETAERFGKGWEEVHGFLRTKHMWTTPREVHMIKRKTISVWISGLTMEKRRRAST